MRKRTRKRKLFFILKIVFVVCCIGITWQMIMVKYENDKYKPIGTLVDVNSYQSHAYIKGEGDVTVVFITGSGTPCAYTDFYYLQKELSNYTKTVSFDHAGFGWSSTTKASRKVDNLVTEMNDLLEKTVPENSDIIIVCHSLGSLEAIRFAQEYSERVKGIVFLDGGSPEFYENYSEVSAMLLNRTGALLRTVGVNRLLGILGVDLIFTGEDLRNKELPSDIAILDKVMYWKHLGNSRNIDNINLINENAREVLENGKIGNIPILILSADSDSDWEKSQDQLATWSTNSTHIVIKDSKHYIHWSNKEEVLKLVSEFVGSLISE